MKCGVGQAFPEVVLEGGPESHYLIQWNDGLAAGTWITLLDIPSLPFSPYVLSDTNPNAESAQRFYRGLLLNP
jgi:hypothetical protein